ncbi:MAG: hypothetical protein MZV49_02635 [Rhodopseudomonas palustris]|nr:hypothetical protein [Rhodopseudomonas palustris]
MATVDPAAQRRRAVRRRAAPDRESRAPRSTKLLELRPGPGFPDRRRASSRPRDSDRARPTAPGAARFRAARQLGSRKTSARGTWQIVVTEIPYQVQKSRLIEQIAELLDEKKLPLLGDVRDEIAPRTCASCSSRRAAASIRSC